MVCDLDQAQQSETSVAAIRQRGLCHYWYSELLQACTRRASCLPARPNPAVSLLWRGMEAVQSFLRGALSSRSFLSLEKLVAALLSVLELSCLPYCFLLYTIMYICKVFFIYFFITGAQFPSVRMAEADKTCSLRSCGQPWNNNSLFLSWWVYWPLR